MWGSGDQIRAGGGLPLTEIIFTGLRRNSFGGVAKQESGEITGPPFVDRRSPIVKPGFTPMRELWLWGKMEYNAA